MYMLYRAGERRLEDGGRLHNLLSSIRSVDHQSSSSNNNMARHVIIIQIILREYQERAAFPEVSRTNVTEAIRLMN